MGILNGFTPTTAKDFQLGAGYLVAGTFDVESFDGSEIPSPARIIGVSSGGWKITATPEFWDVYEGVDGALGSYKGGKRYSNWDIKLSGSTKAVNYDNMKLALISTKPPSGTQYEKIEINSDIKDEDYTVISWVGTIAGSTKPIVIRLLNVLNTNGLQLTAEDKSTGTVEFEFVAHFDPAKPSDVPLEIYLPKDVTELPNSEM